MRTHAHLFQAFAVEARLPAQLCQLLQVELNHLQAL